MSAGGAMLQVRRGDDDDAEQAVRDQLQKVLRDLGRKYNSYAMMEMASAATADPFSKVRGLIEDVHSIDPPGVILQQPETA